MTDKKKSLKRAWDLANKERVKENTKAWALANPEKVGAWAKANPEKDKQNKLAYYEANKDKVDQHKAAWRAANKAKVKESTASWRRDNPGRARVLDATSCAKRRAIKKSASPEWANEFFISEVYDLAKLRSASTGMVWHVDHIVPINSKFVCGLHCEYNLQLLPMTVNASKGNRYWDGM